MLINKQVKIIGLLSIVSLKIVGVSLYESTIITFYRLVCWIKNTNVHTGELCELIAYYETIHIKLESLHTRFIQLTITLDNTLLDVEK